MKLEYSKIPIFALLIVVLSAISCSDDWDKHYSAQAANKSNLNLYAYIQSDTTLTTFTKMLKSTGYDNILNKSQTYTVWAPTNAALANVNLSDTALVRKIVNNHITRFSYTTSGIISKTILMLDNKLLVFAKGASPSGYTFGGKPIVTSDLATANGIIHILSEYAPYQTNFWEYISQTNGLDSLKAYINSLNHLVIDNSKSFQNGVFVDSVMKNSNVLFERLAALNVEDSVYTAILPNNAAWTEAYSRIKPYYNMLNKDGGAAEQRTYTETTLVNDLFFRGNKTLPISVDTLKSTGGNAFGNPNRLFANSQAITMSNGIGYVTSLLKSTSVETWFKPISVEAENSLYGRTVQNYTPSVVSSIGTGYNVSNGNYLSLLPTTSGSTAILSAKFPIPGTLSAKYNIYCVFVPTTIVDTTDKRPYKVRFYLSYVNSAGIQVTDANIDANNNVLLTTRPVSGAGTGATFITDGTTNPMLVANGFVFPYSNVVFDPNSAISKSITVFLKVENAAGVSSSEMTNYNRNLRIDRIILVPVP